VLDRTDQIAADRVAKLVRRVMGNQPVARPIGPDDDLRACGLSSLGLVNLMLSVETEFGLPVPEREMTPANFRTIARIVELVDALSNQSALPA
jgi:acyl carrier protein